MDRRAVIQTEIGIGAGGSSAVLHGGNAAIAYMESGNMFGETDGILGLAYAPLDDAFTMPADTWAINILRSRSVPDSGAPFSGTLPSL